MAIDFSLIQDFSLFALEIVRFVRLRPLSYRKAIDICLNPHMNNPHFRKELLKEAIYKGPFLAYQLYKENLFDIDSLIKMVKLSSHGICAWYFHEIYPDFPNFEDQLYIQNVIKENQSSLLENDRSLLKEMIEYGFPLNSIGFCLKYDDSVLLQRFARDPVFDSSQTIKWSVFEWSFRPSEQTLIAVSAHFGAISCFKYLLINGGIINEKVMNDAIYGGHLDIVRICSQTIRPLSKFISSASQYFRHQIFAWIQNDEKTLDETCLFHSNIRSVLYHIQNKVNINARKNHQTLLHLAAISDNIDFINYLIENGADTKALVFGFFLFNN